jgi:hypothetical protein
MAKNGRKLYPEGRDKTVVICGGYADELYNILVRLNRKMLSKRSLTEMRAGTRLTTYRLACKLFTKRV